MKASKKRGFTIIELVIVIAVIAILAAVLIPTFSNVIQKAKEANDTVMVKSMNTALVNDSNLNGGKKHATMSDALSAAKSAGYDVEKIRSTANNNKILWDSVSDCFVYMNGTEITYIPDSKDAAADTTKKYNYFDIVDTAAEVASSDYSTYLAGTSATGDITAKAGFDAGENTAIASVTYTNASSAQNVIIRTAGGDLAVNAESDTVKHYGFANSVDIVAIAGNSYHEYGKVGFVNVTSGRLAVESTAEIVTVYAAANTAKIDNNAGAIENAYAASGVENSGNLSLNAIPDGKTAEEIKSEAVNKHNAVAKVGDSYQSSLEAAFTKALALENVTIEILVDIDLSNSKWNPVDMQSSTTLKNLTIEGNNHVISGLNVHRAATNDPKGDHQAGASNYYGTGFIGRNSAKQQLTINNLTFANAVIDDSEMQSNASNHTSGVAVVIGISYGKTTLNNVNVKNSSVYGGEKVAVMVGFTPDFAVNINGGSVTGCSVTCTYYYSALVVGMATVKPVITNIEIVNCSNKYDSTCSYASKEFFVNDNGDTCVYVDNYWMMAAWNFSVASMGGFDESITHNGITATSNGHAYEYVKNGNLYSVK